MILVQPFPDGNHRTGLLAAQLMMERASFVIAFDEDAAAAFQRKVSGLRRARLGGFEDAPLLVLDSWDDEIHAWCERFLRRSAGLP